MEPLLIFITFVIPSSIVLGTLWWLTFHYD